MNGTTTRLTATFKMLKLQAQVSLAYSKGHADMCGLTGYLDLKQQTTPDHWKQILTRMTAQLIHRGPDDEGVWYDPEAGIGLGFRRLSILDCSPAGHQPMLSPCGRYVMVFNGEIYNFQQLRPVLEKEGFHFRGRSDTEVLLAAFSRWGIERTLARLNGMFAIAVWDRQEQRLSLIRDRLGEKPLYYGFQNDFFLFGSELKALRAHPAFQNRLDRSILPLYLRYSCIPAPHTIFENIYKLPPGTLVQLTPSQATIPAPVPYWSLEEVIQNGLKNPSIGKEAEILKETESLLRSAVAQRMISDVPLGAFLSGGIDSSLVVALMQVQSSIPVKTFTIGFEDPDYDEAEPARRVAQHLGTEHTEIYLNGKQTMEVIPELSRIYDEPFADSSQIPTLLVSRLARKQVTVCLSGDGGDEVFGGYNRYLWAPSLWKNTGWIPLPLRRTAATILERIPSRLWEKAFSSIYPVVPQGWRQRHPADSLQKLLPILLAGNSLDIYRRLTSCWQEPEHAVLTAGSPNPFHSESRLPSEFTGFLEQMMFLDTIGYLPNDILVKLDRASMSESLEARVPLLDYQVLEHAWRLPAQYKIRNGKTKWILRQLLGKHVPAEMFERPKTGFAIPLHQWLRGPLKGWAQELLQPERLQREGLFRADAILQKWEEHQAGIRNWQHPLWAILMFQSWQERNR